MKTTMSFFAIPLNLSSVALVHNEMQSKLTSTLSMLESYLHERNQNDLAELKAGLHQLSGVFKILQFHGVEEISVLLTEVVDGLVKDEIKLTEPVLNAIGHATFVMPRYIDYCMAQGHSYPVLLNAFINKLSVIARQPIQWEHQLLNIKSQLVPSEKMSLSVDEQKQLKRLHHMYQVGLLGLCHGKSQQQYGRLMAHVSQRIQDITSMNHVVWSMLELTLTALVASKLHLNFTRIRLFMAMDGYFRQLSKGGVVEISSVHGDELIYLLSIVDSKSIILSDKLAQFGCVSMSWNDADYAEHFDNIIGPGREIIAVLSTSLREELLQARDILELVSQTEVMDEWPRLLQIIGKVESILSFLGLNDMAKTLNQLIVKLDNGADNKGVKVSNLLIEAASTLLYIESAILVLKTLPNSSIEAKCVSQAGQSDVVASVLLYEATDIVVREGISAMTLAKRAIANYVDSGFDYSHIANLNKTLNTVSGFLAMLGHQAAALVLEKCKSFVVSLERSECDNEQKKVQIELLADAMIGMEHYIAELTASGVPNQELLVIAEQGVLELAQGENL